MFTTEKRACGDKNQYESKQKAADVAAYLVREKGAVPERISIYRCDYCGWWHIGHKRTKYRGVKGSWSTA